MGWRAPSPFLPVQTVELARKKLVNGMTLISMVNTDRLGEIGITKMKRTQLLWTLEVRA